MLDWLISLLLAFFVVCGVVFLAYNLIPVILFLFR